MVEFKQIVGRGTRLFDGKDYFTIYDYFDNYKHFADSEWDGEILEPIEPRPPKEPKDEKEPCGVCEQSSCICNMTEPEICEECHNIPCVCETKPRQIIRVKLSDGKFADLDSMIRTLFYSPDGKAISAEQFVRKLFEEIPKFFSSEADLREIWSLPDTRKRLLEELSEAGYSLTQLENLKNIVNASDSDLFDVLSYIAYHKDVVPRIQRATKAKLKIVDYDAKKQEFLDFVLKQYVDNGIKELDDARLKDLLLVKYDAIDDAKKSIGDIKTIRETFIGFQKYLYEDEVMNNSYYDALMVAEPSEPYGSN